MIPEDSTPIALEQIDCPLCGESSSRQIVEAEDHQWGIAGRFSVVECEQCHHRFMNPRPVLSSLADCYPEDYGPHQLAPAEQTPDVESSSSETPPAPWYLRYLPLRYVPGLRSFFYWLTNERSQVIPDPFLADVNANDSPKAFELGCAAGAYLAALRGRGWKVVGVEPGAGPVATAQAAGLDVRHGTLDNAAPESASFDFAASWMVIEHVPDPRKTLTQLHTLLKPGGKLAISVPNAGCWEPNLFGANWDAWDLPRHLHHFTPQSMRRLLQECGFCNVQITYQRTLLNVFGSIGIMLTRRNANSRLGSWFLKYPHAPQLPVQLAAAPIAHALAFLRQGGRLTITADRAADDRDATTEKSGSDA